MAPKFVGNKFLREIKVTKDPTPLSPRHKALALLLLLPLDRALTFHLELSQSHICFYLLLLSSEGARSRELHLSNVCKEESPISKVPLLLFDSPPKDKGKGQLLETEADGEEDK
ncbi:unnamed protein product [Ilex paraguariensis]|uniref:Uncharacterized protein n=1 Tax=Ilex paraguariensis TaxID=185542 RepID=A0ABC8RLA7_9AQUA